ncbi:MAG: dTMP kinase [Clostridia bacterium]
MKQNKVKIISFEGVDGSGKGSLIKMLKEYLEKTERFSDFVFTRESGGSTLSEKIRTLLMDTENSMSGFTEFFLFSSSRRNTMEQVTIPALNAGKIVIYDRFVDSSIAYQGFGRGVSLKMIKKINKLATMGHSADITFLISIKPEDGLARNSCDISKMARFELDGINLQRLAYAGYDSIARKDRKRVFKIDNSDNIENAFNEILRILEMKGVINCKK